MPGRIPENMPDKMPENIKDKEKICQNISQVKC
jgi:hypothetical protein